MKKVVYIVLSFLLLTGCTGLKEVKVEKVVTHLQNRHGIKYEPSTEVGFTGVYVEEYINGQKKVEKHYKDGEEDGLWTEWDEDGNIISTKTYKNGTLVQQTSVLPPTGLIF
jgi:D-serine dehydratase